MKSVISALVYVCFKGRSLPLDLNPIMVFMRVGSFLGRKYPHPFSKMDHFRTSFKLIYKYETVKLLKKWTDIWHYA
jgi:hypothetical protein